MKRNKKKSNKVVTELDIESLQAELDIMKRKKRHHKPNKPSKRKKADRRK